MSDLVKRDTDGWVDVLPAVGDLAGKIASTDFVPDAMRGKPAVVAAAILYGRELDLPPMVSLRSINVIKGKPALSAEAMRAMILAAGHELTFQEMTSARCVIVGRRKGQDATTTVTYTMDDAKKAGLAGQQQYSKMPRQMLAARATAEIARLIFADVIGGLVADIEVDDDAAEPIAAVTPITRAKRAKAMPDAVPAEPEPTPAPAVEQDPEPVLDDDVIDAEIVEQAEPAPAPDPVTFVKEELGGEVIEEKASGPALLRQALAEHRAPKEGPITPAQLKALQAAFKDCGVTDREERLAIAANLAHRPDLATANDLTAAEAKAVLDGLAFAKATDNPRATLEASK